MSAIAAALWRRVLVLALVAGAVWSGNPAASPMMGRPALVPNDPYYTAGGLRWIFEKSGFEDAWSRTLGDSSVVVAVVDTGVDETPDLRGAHCCAATTRTTAPATPRTSRATAPRSRA